MQHVRLFLLLALPALIGAHAPATRPASPALADLSGKQCKPLESPGTKATVILYISTDCPISNGYAPEINRICKDYQAKGVCFFLVHADRDLTVAEAGKHAKEFGFTCPILIDRQHELARVLGVTITPEAAVVTADGTLFYRGRIDDLYVSLGKRRYEATTHDLRAALDALLGGKPAPAARTLAVGCTISN